MVFYWMWTQVSSATYLITNIDTMTVTICGSRL